MITSILTRTSREEGGDSEVEGKEGRPGPPKAVFLFSFLLSFYFFCLFPFAPSLCLVLFFRAPGEAGEGLGGVLLCPVTNTVLFEGP